MNNHALTILEYPEALNQIADYAHGELVQKRIQSIRPAVEESVILQRQRLYRQLEEVRHAATLELPLFEPPDLNSLLQRVRPRNSVLGNEDLCRSRRTLRMMDELAVFLNHAICRELTELKRLRTSIDPLSDLLRSLEATFDDEGEIKDSASPELSRIRKRIQAREKEIRRTLDKVVADDSLASVLQERHVTLRHGRYVLPVKREAQSEFSGVVHDHSDSGRTLFVEPSSVLPLGNALADLYADEEDECRRIRAALSDLIRGSRQQFMDNQYAMVEFCAAVAVLHWTSVYDCHLPLFGNSLDIKKARHPLLMQRLAEEPPLASTRKAESTLRCPAASHNVVPLDLQVEAERRALVVTGSNSGGKTVAVKTVGLLNLLAQSGLPVPASSQSCFTIFDSVFADIGDEQSLTENLSTFTGHMRRISEIMEQLANGRAGRTLVILDELGTGTDPLEGGALACAILDGLAESDCLTLATTHLGVVKAFVHDDERMQNASVLFNMETLQPEYVLEVGRPGASHALNIAARLGLPDTVLAAARKTMGTDQLHLEQLLDDLEDNRRLAEQQEKEAREHLSQAARDREKLSSELADIQRDRRRMLHEAYEEASRIVAETRRKSEQMVRRLQNTGKRPEEVVKKTRDEIAAEAAQIEQQVQATYPRPRQPLDVAALQPGTEVWVEKLQSNAVVKSVSSDGRKVRVTIGDLEFKTKAGEIGVTEAASPGADELRPPVRETRPKIRRTVSDELNLVGWRVHQALPRVEQFLDEASLAGLPEVRVIHGYGSGRLQKAVHEYLLGNPAVSIFELGDPEKTPGGRGVTIVQLK